MEPRFAKITWNQRKLSVWLTVMNFSAPDHLASCGRWKSQTFGDYLFWILSNPAMKVQRSWLCLCLSLLLLSQHEVAACFFCCSAVTCCASISLKDLELHAWKLTFGETADSFSSLLFSIFVRSFWSCFMFLKMLSKPQTQTKKCSPMCLLV